jgi:hypothetical protein
LYLNREERLKEIMDKLAYEKTLQKEKDLKTIGPLKAQLYSNEIVVNADRTPV